MSFKLYVPKCFKASFTLPGFHFGGEILDPLIIQYLMKCSFSYKLIQFKLNSNSKIFNQIKIKNGLQNTITHSVISV